MTRHSGTSDSTGIKGRAVGRRGHCALSDWRPAQCDRLCCVLPSADFDLGIVLATTPIATSGKLLEYRCIGSGDLTVLCSVRGLESLWGCCVLPPLQDCSASAVFVGLWDSCALGVPDLVATSGKLLEYRCRRVGF